MLRRKFICARSGDGDIDTTKLCEADIKYFCVKIKPGEGRLATCLSNQIEEEAKGSVTGRKTTKECQEEVRQFKIDRYLIFRFAGVYLRVYRTTS